MLPEKQEFYKPNEALKLLPESSGVYFFWDSNHTIIYIGHSKNLKRRVKDHLTPPTLLKMPMVHPDTIELISWKETDDEFDAMRIEKELEKEFKPYWNYNQLHNQEAYRELKKKNPHRPITAMSDVSGFFKDGDVLKLYDACRTLRDKILVRMLWKTGRRITEVLRVRVVDIDFPMHKILFNINKKGYDLRKWKPIDDLTFDLVSTYILLAKLEQEDFLFHNGNPDQPISRQRAFAIIRDLGKRTGINYVGKKKIHPHHFRHTFAVDMAKRLKSPADIRKLQMMLEHSHLNVTENYLQFAEDETKDLLNQD